MFVKKPYQHYALGWIMGLIAGLITLGCQPQANTPVTSAAVLGQQLPITAQARVKDQTIDLEVAETKAQQAMGLMHRASLPDNRGMLFPFEPPQRVSFWMKNVSIDLDMVFLRQGRIVEIHTATPCRTTPCPLYDSKEPIDQVIELRGGRAAELGLQKGDQIPVEFTPD